MRGEVVSRGIRRVDSSSPGGRGYGHTAMQQQQKGYTLQLLLKYPSRSSPAVSTRSGRAPLPPVHHPSLPASLLRRSSTSAIAVPSWRRWTWTSVAPRRDRRPCPAGRASAGPTLRQGPSRVREIRTILVRIPTRAPCFVRRTKRSPSRCTIWRTSSIGVSRLNMMGVCSTRSAETTVAKCKRRT